MRVVTIPIVAAVASLSACVGDVSEDVTGRQAGALSDDPGRIPDVTTAPRESSVQVGGGESCTGTLITRVNVMTAAHCLENDGTGVPGADWFYSAKTVKNIRFPNKNGVVPPIRATAFYLRSKEPAKFSGIPAWASALDIAVGTLDTRVATTSVMPVHPWEPGMTCETGGAKQDSVTTGFSNDGVWGDQRFQATKSVDCAPLGDRKDVCYGGGFPNTTKGDSGGPLFRFGTAGPSDSGLHIVCGVASASDTGVSIWARTYNHGNEIMISNLAQESGSWKGELAPGTADRDHDDVPDSVDNCPDLHNTAQFDFDRDKIGDACDPCPLKAVGATVNSNSAEESHEGTIARPDICDPVPLVSVDEDGQFTAPSSSRFVDCTVRTPATACEPAPGRCEVARGNAFSLRGFYGDNPNGPSMPDRLTGHVAIRRCVCRAGGSEETCRTDPDAQCFRDGPDLQTPQLGETSGNWLAMTLVDLDASSPSNITTLADPIAVLPLGNVNQPKETRWRSVAWDYEADGVVSTTPLPSVGSRNEIFRGVIWTWVKHSWHQFQDTPSKSSPTDAWGPANSRLRQIVKKVTVEEVHPGVGVQSSPLCDVVPIVPLPRTPLFRPGGWQPPPCTTCGSPSVSKSVFVRYASDGPAEVVAQSPYTSDEDWTSYFDAQSLAMIGSPANVVVMASDDIQIKHGDVVGVVLDKATHSAVAQLKISGNKAVAEDVTSTNEAAGDAIVAALSAHRQELAIFGERLAGAVSQTVRFRNLVTGVETRRDVLSFDARFEQPVAAVYVAREDSYFVADRGALNDGRMRLLRLNPAGALELIGDWPAAPNARKIGLTAGLVGDIVISSWSDADYRVAVVDLAADGLILVSYASGTGGLFEPAYSGLDGVFVTPALAGKRQPPRAVTNSSQVSPGIMSEFF